MKLIKENAYVSKELSQDDLSKLVKALAIANILISSVGPARESDNIIVGAPSLPEQTHPQLESDLSTEENS